MRDRENNPLARMVKELPPWPRSYGLPLEEYLIVLKHHELAANEWKKKWFPNGFPEEVKE